MEVKNVFDYLNSINLKNYLPPDPNLKIYNQFIINKGLSYYPDTIELANAVNVQGLTDQQHYDFLYYAVEKRQRRSKWFKEDRDDNIDLVIEYYEVNATKAKELMKVLSAEDFETIRKALEKGG